MMAIRSKVSKGLDLLILVASNIIIAALVALGYFGIRGLLSIMSSAVSLEGALMYAAILVGMAGGILYWLEMWINAADKAWKGLRVKEAGN